MYLNVTLPLPVNSSPGWVFPRQNFEGRVELMHRYLARIMMGIAEFKQSLERWVLFIQFHCIYFPLILEKLVQTH